MLVRVSEGKPVVDGILGYDDSVLPQLEHALIAGHDVILLGERGQAKSRIIRSLVDLLDEWLPVVAGSEINDDPYQPVSASPATSSPRRAKTRPIAWVHRSDRYGEKLATPDTSIADLIGEVDPIKVAEGRYLSDELTLHYGLVPRTNRGIFAINELPDLAERIQVGLLDVLEERDVQIRGHRVRLPLDILLVASANPEDYTNRGRIITPLKDRFGAQIRTHYPQDLDTELDDRRTGGPRRSTPRASGVEVPEYMSEIVGAGEPACPPQPEGQPALGRFGAPERGQPGDARSRRHPPCAAARRDRGGPTSQRPRWRSCPRRSASSRSSRSKKDEDEEVVDKLINAAVLQTFREHCPTETLGQVVGGFDDGKVVHAGPDLSLGGLCRASSRSFLASVRLSRCSPCGIARARPRSPAAVELVLEGLHLSKRLNKDARRGAGDLPGDDRTATWRTSNTRAGTAPRPASTSTRTAILSEIKDDLIYHGDIGSALRRLLQQGFQDRNGRHVEGMQELLERIRERRRAGTGAARPRRRLRGHRQRARRDPRSRA